MPKSQEGLEQLFAEQMEDLLDAENQLVKAIPQMSKAAHDQELSDTLNQHLGTTKGHVERLERAFEALNRKPRSRACKGIHGIIEEGYAVTRREHGQPVLDTAIAVSARKVEHYEIAAYESACGMARQLGMTDTEGLLRLTIEEEAEADRVLARIAERLAREVVAQREAA